MEFKTYSKLITIPKYEDRYEYLRLNGTVADETFGGSRWLNQVLYKSQEWKRFRNQMIMRDSLNGDFCCDLAFPDRRIGSSVFLHHINPITVDDIRNRSSSIFDPENVVCVAFRTHEAIHYGSEALLIHEPVERTANDTCPWRR